MAFNSIEFLVFLPTVLVLYYFMPFRFRWVVLLAASYFFYMSWKPIYALLLLGTTVVAYAGGLFIQRTEDARARNGILLSCLLALLGVLFVYKYFNFFNDTFRAIAQAIRMPYAVPSIDVVLPLGISFFTFQKVAYLVDVYRRTVTAEHHFGRFALFAAYFPQLVAGPIERAKNLLPQLSKDVRFESSTVMSGLSLVAWGMFKKVVVADRLAVIVNTIYDSPQNFGGISLVFATVCFAFQVYCDFSAYSDIAIGAARTMGVKLTDNFRYPYFSLSISEFWKRWHISLSTWLTDYVYTPLTRSAIPLRWYPKFLLSLLLTFLVSGLWHGANWTFVAWGALHGTYLVCSVATQSLRGKFVRATGLARVPKIHSALRMAMTFSLVCLSYVFFRSASLTDALYIVTHSFDGWASADVQEVIGKLAVSGGVPNLAFAVLGVLTVVGVDANARFGTPVREWRIPAIRVAWPAYYLVVLSMVVLGALYGTSQTFIYFQF